MYNNSINFIGTHVWEMMVRLIMKIFIIVLGTAEFPAIRLICIHHYRMYHVHYTTRKVSQNVCMSFLNKNYTLLIL